MSEHPKLKLCWNCEGSVAVSEETCPYCGVSVIPASLDGSPPVFSPPYHHQLYPSQEVPRPPYMPYEEKKVALEERTADPQATEGSFQEFNRGLAAVMFLLTGSVFFLFGLVLAFFSHDGHLTLRWDGTWWFAYLGISVPLLIVGWRALLKIES
jgi:hypothetical protein